ncbi:MAG TPA: DUF3253 domain-containing protein [Burkholderiaceae bacterium]|nr:DUF3253 domain-containing protein [Burkholderiaceae bacterium]
MTTDHAREVQLPPNAADLLAGLLRARAAEASICPSELARALAASAGEREAWRRWMPAARQAALAQARLGRVCITQGRRECLPDEPLRGAVRIRRGPRFDAL